MISNISYDQNIHLGLFGKVMEYSYDMAHIWALSFTLQPWPTLSNVGETVQKPIINMWYHKLVLYSFNIYHVTFLGVFPDNHRIHDWNVNLLTDFRRLSLKISDFSSIVSLHDLISMLRITLWNVSVQIGHNTFRRTWMR